MSDRLLTPKEIYDALSKGCGGDLMFNAGEYLNEGLSVAQAQRELTLKAVGERLEEKLQGESCAFIYEENDLGLKAIVECLKRGEWPG